MLNFLFSADYLNLQNLEIIASHTFRFSFYNHIIKSNYTVNKVYDVTQCNELRSKYSEREIIQRRVAIGDSVNKINILDRHLLPKSMLITIMIQACQKCEFSIVKTNIENLGGSMLTLIKPVKSSCCGNKLDEK